LRGKSPGLSLKHIILLPKLNSCLKPLTSLLCIVSLSDQKNITAESGQDVILTCRAPNYTNQNFNWSRADLGDEYVLLYRDEVFVPDNQHPSFKNRVDLQDRQMKDGDVSLILKNVTINDTGTYECVLMNGINQHICNITLSVLTPHTCFSPAVSVGLIVGVVVAAALVVAAVAGFVIYRNHKKAK
uniref:Ig-like domain-containing protein n=1 Tax=Oreochromis aureus TaxID=47969 RepID=A0AAZ1XT19_OREAU